MAVCRDREKVSEGRREEIRELLFSEEFWIDAMALLVIPHSSPYLGL